MLNKSDKKFFIKLLLISLTGILVVVKFDAIKDFLFHLLGLLSPLFLGLLFALFLNRPVEFFKKHFQKIRGLNNDKAKIPAIIVSYLCFLGALIGLILIIIPQLIDSIGEFISDFDRYSQSFTSSLSWISQWLKQYNIDPDIISDLGKRGLSVVDSLIEWIPGVLSNFISGMVSTIATFFLGLIISIYILIDKKHLKQEFVRTTSALIPEKNHVLFGHVFSVIQRVFSTYIYTQITEMLILGFLVFVGAKILGFPYPLIIGVVNGLSVLIPVIGAWLCGIIGGVFILFAKPDMLLGYLIFILAMQGFENNFIYPRRVKDSVGLPQIWVLVAITVGGGLLGMVGVLISVPIASIIYQLVTESVERKEQKQRLQTSAKQ